MMEGRAVTKAEAAWHDLLGTRVGCICCILDTGCIDLEAHQHYVSIHHCYGRTKPWAHWYVLPLCERHHQGRPGHNDNAVHVNKARFEATYGKQVELLMACVQVVERFQEAAVSLVERRSLEVPPQVREIIAKYERQQAALQADSCAP